METFEEYLSAKKIDGVAFSQAEKSLWDEFKFLFDQMHTKSFTAQKLFLINNLRRRFPLKDQLPVKAKKKITTKPVMKPVEAENQTGDRTNESTSNLKRDKGPRPKTIAKPKVVKKPQTQEKESAIEAEKKITASRPKIKPRVSAKPKIPSKDITDDVQEAAKSNTPKKPRPKIKPKIAAKPTVMDTPVKDQNEASENSPQINKIENKIKPKLKPKVIIKPKIKPPKKD